MKEQRRVYEALSKIYSEGKEELSSEKVELNIEEAIKREQEKAKKLQQEINSYAASARSVISAIDNAEKSYAKAEKAFKEFKDLEEEAQKYLDFADDSYRGLDQNTAFGKLNQLMDINEELARYGAKQFPANKSRVAEMREAVDKWKRQQFPKIK